VQEGKILPGYMVALEKWVTGAGLFPRVRGDWLGLQKPAEQGRGAAPKRRVVPEGVAPEGVRTTQLTGGAQREDGCQDLIAW
jgi:hypothetical protein